jgi:hypothetical protein
VFGDIAQSFETFGESAGGLFGGKVGSAISNLGTVAATAFGVGGLAYIAVTTFWNLFTSGSADAKKRIEEVAAAQLLLASGNTLDAVKKLNETYGQAIDNAEQLGRDPGRDDPVPARVELGVGPLLRQSPDHRRRPGRHPGAPGLTSRISPTTKAQAVADLLQPLFKARQEYKRTGTDLESLQRQQFETLKGVDASTEAYLGLAKEALPAVRGEIVKYLAQQNEIPESVVTSYGSDIDEAELADIERRIDLVARNREIAIKFEGDFSKLISDYAALARRGLVPPLQPLGSSASSAGSVTINVPATLNPAAVVDAVAAGQHRNGSLRRGP